MHFSLPNIPEERALSQRTSSIKSRTFTSGFFLPSLNNKQESGSSVTVNSRNFFTTVLKEETEEIIEEDIAPQAYIPSYVSLEGIKSRFPKTMPNFEHHYTLFRKTELMEENKLRSQHIEKLVKDLKKQKTSHEFLCDADFRAMRSHLEARERVIKLSEDIFNLYNIRYKFAEVTTQDCLMSLEKIKDRLLLANSLEVLIKEISKFPFSFFKKIGMQSFIFCERIEFHKDPRNPMISKKLFAGLFSTTALQKESDIVDYFYRNMFYHMKQQIPDLDTHWAKVYIKKSKTIMHISMDVTVKESTRPKRGFFDDQWKLFRDLIITPNASLKHESNVIRIKAFKLKDCMEKLDADGISDAWWKKLGLSLVVGSLDHL